MMHRRRRNGRRVSSHPTFLLGELVGLPLRRRGLIVEIRQAQPVLVIVAVGRRGVLRGFTLPSLRKLDS
jgi:hypothetical protein